MVVRFTRVNMIGKFFQNPTYSSYGTAAEVILYGRPCSIRVGIVKRVLYDNNVRHWELENFGEFYYLPVPKTSTFRLLFQSIIDFDNKFAGNYLTYFHNEFLFEIFSIPYSFQSWFRFMYTLKKLCINLLIHFLSLKFFVQK